MIVDRLDSHFIFIVSSDHVHGNYHYIQYDGHNLTNKEYLTYWGKWIIFGEKIQLDHLARQIDPHVENKIIPAAKYDRKVIDAFRLEECVMCVYCDFRQRDDVWRILDSIGVKDKIWVYEAETMKRWLPGGHLLEKWIKGKSLENEAAEKVRRDAQNTFDEMFKDENAEFRGIVQ
jgi:hypothetical protein